MKQAKLLLTGIAVFSLLFTSCSKEESETIDNTDATATLSFGAVLNDIIANRGPLKQSLEDIPECSDETPSYVEVVLSGTQSVGSMTEPVMIDINPTPGDYDNDGEDEYFTMESSDLELVAGSYSLDYFAVYDASDNLIWIAPGEGSLAGFVDNALPLDIELGDGVKKYVDVDVLCYDERLVNEYGYLFFELEGTEAIEFCIFGNFCPPSGRHYPAEFSVDVWMYDNGQRGAQLYSDLSSTVEPNDDGDYAGTPLCVALPDREGEDEYYFEITLLSSDAYGNVEERVIRSGVINDVEVKNLFDGDNNLDYYHFREGCENDDTPPILPDPTDEADHYKACMTPENGSEAIGFAYFRLEGDVLESTVMATGLEANREHLQHIHENEDCDNPGPPILSLNEEDGSWPVATGMFGDVVYHRTFTLGSGDTPSWSEIGPLEERSVNLHGMTVDGSYNAGIVVACGPIIQNEDF